MTDDQLDQFAREDRITSGDSPLSLHEVGGRGVSVHWDEAVAIVEELCEVAIATSGDAAPVPALEDVLIGSDGRITLRRTRGDKSPTAAGRMLHTLMSSGSAPMPLRLFVTQSTAHDTHQSLREFARGLAYFGKPGRERLIQDVYARCVQAGRRPADAAPVHRRRCRTATVTRQRILTDNRNRSASRASGGYSLQRHLLLPAAPHGCGTVDVLLTMSREVQRACSPRRRWFWPISGSRFATRSARQQRHRRCLLPNRVSTAGARRGEDVALHLRP